MLRIILAGAEVELAPPEVAGHPAVRKHAEALGKRPGQVLLDQNLHSAALGKLDDGKRRGRPDLVQVSLLVLQELPITKAGGLEVAIHTRHGEFIRIRPDTRLPRGEARFQGLLAKVLLEGRSQEKDPLVWSEGRATPKDVLKAFARGPVVRLDEGGPATTPAGLAEKAKDGDLTLVLGAFAAGDFPAAWSAAVPDTASIWPQALNVWAVAAEVASGFRARWGPHAPKPSGGSGAAQPDGTADMANA